MTELVKDILHLCDASQDRLSVTNKVFAIPACSFAAA